MSSNMQPVRWDPSKGCAFQGDVGIFALPKNVKFKRSRPVKLENSMLTLSSGEQLGHHHAFRFIGFNDAAAAETALADTVDLGILKTALEKGKQGARTRAAYDTKAVNLYEDTDAVNKLVLDGFLTTPNLVVGFLEVRDNAPPLTHDEHAPIIIPPGEYIVSRKREMTRAEEHRVED